MLAPGILLFELYLAVLRVIIDHTADVPLIVHVVDKLLGNEQHHRICATLKIWGASKEFLQSGIQANRTKSLVQLLSSLEY